MGCGNAAHRSAALAAGARPVPFRTRKLSRPAPMVLRGKPVGEQGAADRWTAFPHAGAGPRGSISPGAPPLFALTGRLRPTGMLSIGRFSVITPALLPIRARTQLLRSSSQAVRAPRLWFRAVSIPLLRFPSAWYELAVYHTLKVASITDKSFSRHGEEFSPITEAACPTNRLVIFGALINPSKEGQERKC